MSPAARRRALDGGVLAFATVLPGIVETLELLENLGWLRSVRVRPLPGRRGKEKAVLALGAACFVLPLAWPDALLPADLGQLRVPARALEPPPRAAQLPARPGGGRSRPVLPHARWPASSAALLWETWNFWARTKWIYTVPGFEGLKLFEMPLAGFLGFPPFAVECVVVAALPGRPGAIGSRRAPCARRARWRRSCLGPAAVLGMFAAVDPVTVDSVYVPLAGLDVVPARTPRAAGRGRPGQPRAASCARRRTPRERRAWAGRASGPPAEDSSAARARVALVMHRGLGLERAPTSTRSASARATTWRAGRRTRWRPRSRAGAPATRATVPRAAGAGVDERARGRYDRRRAMTRRRRTSTAAFTRSASM